MLCEKNVLFLFLKSVEDFRGVGLNESMSRLDVDSKGRLNESTQCGEQQFFNGVGTRGFGGIRVGFDGATRTAATNDGTGAVTQMACAQFLELQTNYPATTRRLIETYLPHLADAVTDSAGHNAAGYVLYQIHRASRHALSLYGPERATLQVCDHLFSEEVRYQHHKKTAVRNVIPFFGVCWHNLVSERGERFRLAVPIRRGAGENPPMKIVSAGESLKGVLDEIQVRKKSGA